jgi:gentisate 1,2-dioxygenase
MSGITFEPLDLQADVDPDPDGVQYPARGYTEGIVPKHPYGDLGPLTNQLLELYDRMEQLNMEPLWESLIYTIDGKMAEGPNGRRLEPRPPVSPHIWRWRDYYPLLLQAAQLVTLSDSADRRALEMLNPGLKSRLKDTDDLGVVGFTQNLEATVQIVTAGDVAPAHRHNFAALRFVIQGGGVSTIVEHERIRMHEGDLVLTPNWTWHDHDGTNTEPVIWLDALDLRFVNHMEAAFWEPYPAAKQPELKPEGHTAASGGHFGGGVRPSRSTLGVRTLPLIYKFEPTYQTLLKVAETMPDPFDGAMVDYVNPLNGGPTFPTMQCRLQRLAPGEHTRAHRHTGSTLYLGFRGSGTIIMNGVPTRWERGDVFVLPSWYWHEHVNDSSSDEAILFSVSDSPILQAFDLYREEEFALGRQDSVTDVTREEDPRKVLVSV